MATEKPETDGFLAVLDAKITALLDLKESYLKAVSLGALGQRGEIDTSSFSQGNGAKLNATPFDLPTGALLGKSIPQAIKLYLGAVKKKQTTAEVTAALKDGGVESTAANFQNNVNSSLHRLKAAGDVLQFKDGWALAEFYPESLRARIANEAEPKKKRGKGKKTAKNKAEAKAEKPTASKGPGLQQRIISYLQTRGGDLTAVQELVAQLRVAAPVINLMLGKMSKAEKIEKNQDGRVRLTKKAA
jgi:hypothetical protein